jgi:apolipoprotein N-acyltransferase
VVEQTRIFERDLLVADVPLRPLPAGGTFYTRFGNVFVYLGWLCAAGLGIAGGIRQRGERRNE